MTQQHPSNAPPSPVENPASRCLPNGQPSPASHTGPCGSGPQASATTPRAHPASTAQPHREPSARRRPVGFPALTHQKRRPIRRILSVLLLAMLLVPPLPMTHSHAAVTIELYSLNVGSPFFIFDKSRDQVSMYSTHDFSAWGMGLIRFRSTTRAESGMTENDCDKHDPTTGHYRGGWLPNGWYDIIEHHDNYPGTYISGIVWRLSDKRCNQSGGTHSVGTTRTALFLHSNPDPDFSYQSQGCIKVAPSDIELLDETFYWALWNEGRLNGRFRVRP